MSENSPAHEEDYSQDEPVVIVGEPKSLRGELRIRNTGEERVVLKSARMSGVRAKGALASEAAKMASPPAHVSLSAIIHPGQTQRVTLTLDLDDHTPPGEYHSELEVAGRTRPLVIHVAEVVRLKVSPEQVVIDRGTEGGKVTKRVVFSNEGNVQLTIGEIGHVMLGEELLLSLGLHASIASVNDRTEALEDLVVEILREEARTVMRQVGFLEVHNPSAPLILEPGEVRAVDLEIRLPENLSANSRYRGRLPLYTADLEFVIVPGAGWTKSSETQWEKQ